MAIQIQIRNDIESSWITNNPILAEGEIAITFNLDGTVKGLKAGTGLKHWSELEYMAMGGGGNIAKGAFDGVFDVSGGQNLFYDDYIAGASINLSLSETKQIGSMATVRIKGDLTGVIPASWNISGQPISNNLSKLNELTLLYINNNDVRIVNRVVNYNDTEAPTVPDNLTSSSNTATTVDLAWDASTDNVGVTGYKIFVDGVYNKSVASNSGQVAGLSAETTYSFTVSAFDAAGNESAQSTPLIVTTEAAPVVINPLMLENLEMWFDGTDSSKMVLDGANGVNSFTDKANKFTLIATATKQKFETDKIAFVETGHLYSTTRSGVLIPNVDFHGFIIFRNKSATQLDFLINTVSLSQRFGIGLRSGSLAVGTYNGSAFNAKSVAFSDQTNYHKLEFKQVSGVITAYLDGVEMTATNPPFSDNTLQMKLGGAGDSNKAIDFKDLFVKSGEMTTNERNNMLQYILNKHGL
jgi:hypothetical protein